MSHNTIKTVEVIQRMVVKLLAANPAGEGLCLVGGARYRLLDNSCRQSMDLDYHWAGNLESKRRAIASLLSRKLLPLVRAQLGFDGSVCSEDKHGSESSVVKTVELALWKLKGPQGRLIIPIDITRIACLDKPVVRMMDGVVCLSASDADMAESKVIALFNRLKIEERDLVDLFLFQDKFVADSGKRVHRKLKVSRISADDSKKTLKHMITDRSYHIRNIDGIIKEQVDSRAGINIKRAGGGAVVFDTVMALLKDRLDLA